MDKDGVEGAAGRDGDEDGINDYRNGDNAINGPGIASVDFDKNGTSYCNQFEPPYPSTSSSHWVRRNNKALRRNHQRFRNLQRHHYLGGSPFSLSR